MFRQPAVIAGEIAWRWVFGAAAWALILLTLRHILAGVDVSEAEYAVARSSNAFLIADACARVLAQVLPQAGRAALIVAPALTVLWIMAATLGRAATLTSLVEQHHGAAEGGRHDVDSGEVMRRPGEGSGACLISLCAQNVLRAVFTWAAATAFMGTLILTSRAFPHPANPLVVTMLWILPAALIALCWSMVNWFLSLAAIFVVRDRRGTWASIRDSLGLYQRVPGMYTATAFWFGFFRGLALIAAFVFAILAAAASSVTAGVALSVIVALLYFALADLLYIARLAAFLGLHPEPAISAPVEPAPALEG